MPSNCPKGTVKVIVTCNKPTAPPHTNEKNPGMCSRTKGFCVPPGSPKPDWACWQHGGPRYQRKTVPLTFNDCADAANTLSKGLDEKKYAGGTQPALTCDPEYPFQQQPDGSYVFSALLRWSVDADNTIVILPDISWPSMTDADRAAVKSAMDALEAHEVGHVHVAELYADRLNSRGGDRLPPVHSATKSAARAAIEQAVAAREAAVKAMLDKLGDEYDDETQHGAKQSNKGGKDVVLVCP